MFPPREVIKLGGSPPPWGNCFEGEGGGITLPGFSGLWDILFRFLRLSSSDFWRNCNFSHTRLVIGMFLALLAANLSTKFRWPFIG